MTPEQLKASILQYAIQGKLVEQRPEEGTAEELYKAIREEKQKLIKEGKIKKGKSLPKIDEDEIYFDIPETWEWLRLNDIVYNHGQKTPDAIFSYIDIGSIDNIHQKLNSEENLIEANNAPSRARKIVKLGDIIYSTVRPYLHNTSIIDKEFKAEPIASTGFAVLSCHKGIYNKYLFYYLLSPAFDRYANATDNAKGVAYPAINDDKLYRAIIPIPPLAEQHRIVAKIEELLPFVDRYAASYEKLEQFNAKFPEDMKKSILQYAIQGKLVEQRPEEGTAEELYQQIQKEKQKLIKECKIKKEKPLAEITEDEIPFDIPDSWKWCRLQDICTLIADVDHNMPKAVPASVGKLFLSAKDLLDDGTINYTDNVKYISNEDFERLSKKAKPTVKDIIYSRIGAALGKARVVESDVEFIVSYSCCVIRTLIDEKYLRYYLESPLILRHSVLARQSIGVPDLGMGEIKQYIVALPPIEEQKRIVAKITEILPYCDRLVK